MKKSLLSILLAIIGLITTVPVAADEWTASDGVVMSNTCTTQYSESHKFKFMSGPVGVLCAWTSDDGAQYFGVFGG